MRISRSVFVFAACLLLVAASAGAAVEVVDFTSLPVGKVVDEVFGTQGTGPIKVYGFNERFGEGINAAIVFDTGNPTGDDFDLGAPNETFGTEDRPTPGKGRGGVRGAPFENPEPLGKLLILAESLADLDGDGLIDDPDDEGQFRQLSFTLDLEEVGPLTVYRMTLIDVEDQEKTPAVHLYGADGGLIESRNLPITGDNGVVHVDLGPTENVFKMVVELHGSGAISSVQLEKPGPRIDIETLTNGSQADLPTGSDIPFLLIGGPVTWTYQVTNTGTEQLQNVTVIDDRGVEVSCPRDTLEPGESMECSASGAALNLASGDLGFEPVLGVCRNSRDQRLYGNIGSVKAVGRVSELDATDTDPSHYCSGPGVPGIYLRKQKKGPDTRGVPSGTDATFEVFVKNTGGLTLSEVKVADILSPDCNREFASLAPGASRRYTCTAPGLALGGENVTDCRFVNEIVASGAAGGETVTDSDTSTVELIGLEIDKSFAGADEGGATFEITVTNHGCSLDTVEVIDELAPDCERSLGAMAAGDTQTYTCRMALENEACAEGSRESGSVSACDTATFVIESDSAGAQTGDGGVAGEDGGGQGSDAGGASGASSASSADETVAQGQGQASGGGERQSNWLLLVALALLVGGGLFAWNRMKAG